MALPLMIDLGNRIRRAVGDWPQVDFIGAAGSHSTTFAITTTAAVKLGVPVVFPATNGVFMPISGTTLIITGLGNWDGSGIVTDSQGNPILQGCKFMPNEILDAINEAYRNLWPYWFKWVEDEATVTTNQQADYAVPSAFGESGIVTDIEILPPGLVNDSWRNFRFWKHREGTTSAHGSSTTGRTIQFLRIPAAGSYVRMSGIAPFTGDLTWSSTLPTTLLDSAVPAIVMYACSYLMAMGEAKRLGNPTAANVGANASQPGQNQATSAYHQQRFDKYCMTHAQRYPKWRTRRVV